MTTTSAPPPRPSHPAPADLRPRLTGAAVHSGGAAVYSGGLPAPERTLWDVLQATVRRFPEAPALDDGRSVRTYTDSV
jgi:hypothetical protein